jgi:hypothetical protein
VPEKCRGHLGPGFALRLIGCLFLARRYFFFE